MSDELKTIDAEGVKSLHLRFGWIMLLIFIVLGAALEVLHGFKIGWYLDVGNETRRMMLRLAHAHGTLFAVINIIFALSVPAWPGWAPNRRDLASRTLRIGSVLLPGGFLAGGFFIYDGDPGLGVFLAPFGALALVMCLIITVGAARSGR